MLFPWYTKYPYQNDEVLNLDWILKTIDNLVKEVSDFVTLNTIKYADPIQWNITTQYEKNTVVIDPISGSAYISTKPVPAGVGLNNTDYWNIIFTLDVISANKNLTLRDDANNMLATFESVIGDWLLWQGTLYVVTKDIEIGQAYVADYNIERATVEYFLKLYIENLKTYVDNHIGDLDDLETEDKSNIVAAINEILTTVANTIGDLDDLETEDKDNIVAAINEVLVLLGNLATAIGNLNNLETDEKSSIVGAINEVVHSLGDLDSLNTSVKTSIVAAINELLTAITAVDASIYTKKLANREFLCVGDSYGDEPGEWPEQARSFLGISASKWHIQCVSGTGFGAGGFENQISSYTGDKDTITDIIVCGGLNDSNNSDISDPYWTGMISYMNSFNTYVKNNYPNAKIHLGYIGNGVDTSPYISTRVYAARQLCKYMYYQTAASLGWCQIPNIEYALCQNSLMIGSDGVHPSAYGNKELGLAVAEYIVSGYYSSRYVEYNVVGASSYSGDWTKIKYEIFNDRMHIKSAGLSFSVTGGTSFVQLAANTIATLGLQFNRSLYVHTMLMLQNFDNTSWQMVPAQIIFSNQTMTMQIIDTVSHTADAGGGTVSIVNFDVDFPSEYVS